MVGMGRLFGRSSLFGRSIVRRVRWRLGMGLGCWDLLAGLLLCKKWGGGVVGSSVHFVRQEIKVDLAGDLFYREPGVCSGLVAVFSEGPAGLEFLCGFLHVVEYGGWGTRLEHAMYNKLAN